MKLLEIIDYIEDFKPNRHKTLTIKRKKKEDLTDEEKEYVKKNELYKSEDYRKYRETIQKKKYYEKIKKKNKLKNLLKRIENLKKKLEKLEKERDILIKTEN